MEIPSNPVPGMAPGLRRDAGAGEPPRVSLEQPRLGQDLSRLARHAPWQTPLQHAVTKVAGLIVPPGWLGRAGSVNEDSLEHYVRASLGMRHDAAEIDPGVAPYLDELSKNESAFEAEPVTASSFTLLCVLYMADQVPGSAGYGQFGREAFMDWLEQQLTPAAVPDDCIPERYFDAVQVSTNPCTVRFGPDGADSVVVQSMHRANLPGADLRGADLRGPGLRLPQDLPRWARGAEEHRESGRQLPRHEAGPGVRGGRRTE